MRVAIVGSGIAGLVCAHVLHPHHEVTVFEADDRPGGHAHTNQVVVDGRQVAVDTGFLVYNEPTYPGLVRLFDRLGVATQPSDMSFSVSDPSSQLEYAGPSMRSVFADRHNLVRPAFLHMAADVVRFHRRGRAFLERHVSLEQSIGELAAHQGFSRPFMDWYLVPLGSSIWSCAPGDFLQMPAATLMSFLHRHGMLSMGHKPTWRTVRGGAVHYVDAVLAPIRRAGRLRLSSPVEQILRGNGWAEVRWHRADRPATVTERFDHVVVATHSDQALALMADASTSEKEILGDIRYQENQVSLHTDPAAMPANRRSWAAWNYHRPPEPGGRVTVTYWLNRLQSLNLDTPLLVSLNRHQEIDPDKVLSTFTYAHPVMDAAAVGAQSRRRRVNGRGPVSYCGAYWGWGFHEDGLQSALAVCRDLGVHW